MTLDDRIRARLEALRVQGLARRAPAISRRHGVHYDLDGRPVIGFCSNDYLGLADTPAGPDASKTPAGAGASRLIAGDLEAHRVLERRLAQLVGAPDAVLFPSGFQLNVGVLPSLLDEVDHVDSDALNHASLIDGLRLARCARRVLAHRAAPQPVIRVAGALHWWVTESIFSMDGDLVDVEAVVAHQERGGCTYVDEAHALGLFPGGTGLLGARGVFPTLCVGTLSKAFGCAGAFVAASPDVCTWIRTRARSFVFTTGTSPVVVDRILRALDIVTGPDGDARRERLWSNARTLGRLLGEPDPPSPIFPLVVGDNAATVRLSDALLDHGLHVQPIRPPTVPEGTARLRITVSATHLREDIVRLGETLLELLHAHGVAPRIERGLPTPPSADVARTS